MKPYFLVLPALLSVTLTANSQKPNQQEIGPARNKITRHEIRAANPSKDLEAHLAQLNSPSGSKSLLEVILENIIPPLGSPEDSPLQLPPSPAGPAYPNEPKIPLAGVSYPRGRRNKREKDLYGGDPPEKFPKKVKDKPSQNFKNPKLPKHQRAGKLPAIAQNTANYRPKHSSPGGVRQTHLWQGRDAAKKS